MNEMTDAVVIGSGPNGLVAAITLAAKGWDVTVVERSRKAGGAVASAELTAPGFVHDPYAAFFGLLHASPVFQELGLDQRVSWRSFETPAGATTSPDSAAVIRSDRAATAAALGADEAAWLELCGWWDRLGTRFFQQMLHPVGAPGPALRFLRAAKIRGAIDAAKLMLSPLDQVATTRFTSEKTQVLFASGVTHSDLGVDSVGSTPMALILAMLSQTVGMPVAEGGSGKISEALVALLEERGGKVITGDAVTKVIVEKGRATGIETVSGRAIRARKAVMADTGPLALVRDLVGEDQFPARYLDGLRRFRYGTGIFKVDLALNGPVRWKRSELDRCGVVHIAGDLDTMARSASAAKHGRLPAQPLLVVGQQSVVDPTRAPNGGSTLWIETHVPPVPVADDASGAAIFGGWEEARDTFLQRVLETIDAHAPDTSSQIVGMSVRTPVDLEAENPNLVGGDLGGGSSAIDMQLVFRPVPGWFRYSTPIKGLYLCSASTHPGGGVHGMAGRNAAVRALRQRRLSR